VASRKKISPAEARRLSKPGNVSQAGIGIVPAVIRIASMFGRGASKAAPRAAAASRGSSTARATSRAKTGKGKPRTVTKAPAWTSWKEPIKIKVTKKDVQQTGRLQGVIRESGRRSAAASGAAKGTKIQAKPSKGVGTQRPTVSKKQAVVGTGIVAAGGMLTAGALGRGGSSSAPKISSSSLSREHSNRQGITSRKPSAPSVTPTPPSSSFNTVRNAERPKTPKVSTPSASGGSRGTGGGRPSGGSSGVKTPRVPKPKKTVPTVSQSRTMWVKKGETVGGQVVKKGYLAQYGKAEKKVSAKVNIVTDTESGKKAGQSYKYGKGRTIRQVKGKK